MVGLRKLDPPYNNVSLSAQDSIKKYGSQHERGLVQNNSSLIRQRNRVDLPQILIMCMFLTLSR